jgi:hypothetical protein
MTDLLTTALSFPTIVYTVLTFVALGYWVVAAIGLVDLDAGLDGDLGDVGDASAGHGDHADVADATGGDGDAGDADADADSDDADTAAGFAGFLSALRLRHAPLTTTLSILFLLSWGLSMASGLYVQPHVPAPAFAAKLFTLVMALVLAVPATSLLTWPLAPLYRRSPAARRNQDLVGKVVKVRVPAEAGAISQAKLDDSGADLLLRIRAPSRRDLSRGERVLILSYDEAADTFEVEPMDEVMGRPSTDE